MQPVMEAFEPFADDCFLIGAAARDLLFAEYRGIDPPIATADVDFAIGVQSWEVFDAVKRQLIEQHGYRTHAYSHRLTTPRGGTVDLVPFGGVENDDGTITLQEESEKQLTVLGFDAVSNSALETVVNHSVRVRIASPASIVLLKLIAWGDQPYEREKDILDVMYILKHFGDFLEIEAWEDYPDVMEGDPFDWSTASARMVGREVAVLAKADKRCVHRMNATMAALAEDRYTSPAAREGALVFTDPDKAFEVFQRFVQEFEASLQ